MADLHDYGSLLLAARLRKLSEAFYAGVDAVYRAHGVELPARCFPVLFLLRDRGRLGISELAVQLGQSHPAVSQMSAKLLRHGVVREWPDPADQRRRLLGLSPRGRALMRRLAPVWQAIVAAVAELEQAQPLSAALTGTDQALAARGFASRITRRLPGAAPVTIIAYQRRYAADFKRLNLEWLQKYFRVEAVDQQVLAHPERILRSGGAIFFARRGREIVGTCALLDKGDGRIELTKMAVTESCQGAGIGRALLVAAIGAFLARRSGELFLETNSVLRPAIALYESVGFVHAPRPAASGYQRANVYMVYRGRPAPSSGAPATAAPAAVR